MFRVFRSDDNAIYVRDHSVEFETLEQAVLFVENVTLEENPHVEILDSKHVTVAAWRRGERVFPAVSVRTLGIDPSQSAIN